MILSLSPPQKSSGHTQTFAGHGTRHGAPPQTYIISDASSWDMFRPRYGFGVFFWKMGQRKDCFRATSSSSANMLTCQYSILPLAR